MRPLFLYTDFGTDGPYVGLMKAAAVKAGMPAHAVVDLMHDAPRFAPRPAGRLLAALVPFLPADAVVAAVVDPGVGGAREALVVEAAGRSFVGPDNGLLAPLLHLDPAVRVLRIDWRPPAMSASFHGRDLFVPAAARIAADRPLATMPVEPGRIVDAARPLALAEIIHIDDFGNAMTGMDAAGIGARRLAVAGSSLARARTFCDVAPGEAFWYENSLGLAEIAVNRGSAAERLGLEIGTPVQVEGGD